jgi:hypothetical protein
MKVDITCSELMAISPSYRKHMGDYCKTSSLPADYPSHTASSYTLYTTKLACSTCPKAFWTPRQLKRHCRVHTLINTHHAMSTQPCLPMLCPPAASPFMTRTPFVTPSTPVSVSAITSARTTSVSVPVPRHVHPWRPARYGKHSAMCPSHRMLTHLDLQPRPLPTHTLVPARTVHPSCPVSATTASHATTTIQTPVGTRTNAHSTMTSIQTVNGCSTRVMACAEARTPDVAIHACDCDDCGTIDDGPHVLHAVSTYEQMRAQDGDHGTMHLQHPANLKPAHSALPPDPFRALLCPTAVSPETQT